MRDGDFAKFIKWLKTNTQIPKNGVTCQVLRLKHMAAEGGGTTVEAFEAPWDVHGDVGALARKILDRAENDAENVGDSIVAYQVLPYFGQSTQPDGRYALKVRVSQELDASDPSEGPAEGPSNKGQVQQQMRHNENMHRLHVGGMETVLRRMNDTIVNQAAYIEKLEATRVKVLDQQEALMDRQLDRRIKAERELQAQKRMEEGFKLLLMLAPVLVNNLQGNKGIPEREDPNVTQLKMWFASLDDAEITTLKQTLGIKSVTLADFASRFKREYEAQQVSDEHRVQRIVQGPAAAIPSGVPQAPTLDAMTEAAPAQTVAISPHQHEDVTQLRMFFTSLTPDEKAKCRQILSAERLDPVEAMAHGTVAYNANFLRQFFGTIGDKESGPLQALLGMKIMPLASVGMRLRAEFEAAQKK